MTIQTTAENKARRLAKHLRRFPADESGLAAYRLYCKSQDASLVQACSVAVGEAQKLRQVRKDASMRWKAEAKRRGDDAQRDRSRATTMTWASARGVADIVERGYQTQGA